MDRIRLRLTAEDGRPRISPRTVELLREALRSPGVVRDRTPDDQCTRPILISMRELFAFPNPVNEKAARVVAGCVVVLAVLAITVAGTVWLVRGS